MIKYLTRNQLDISKYNSCISNAVNSRIYAYSWYLDIVTNRNWDALVLDNYTAVMPLPTRRKFFINYIYRPSWVQQLGLFSLQENHNELIRSFIKSIPKKFKLIDLILNSENQFQAEECIQKVNFILPLNNQYEHIFNQYNKGRKSNVKQSQNNSLSVVEDYSSEKIIQLFIKNKGKELENNGIEYTILSKLIKKAQDLNLVHKYGVINAQNELVAGAFILKENRRITYLFSSVNDEGRKTQAMTFLIDSIIRKYANTNCILDFEGSMIEGIALFYQSFGAKKESYYHYKKYRFL